MSERRLIREELESEFGELKKLEVGSDKYKAAVDGITKLLDKAIEIDKLELEAEDRFANREAETNLKAKQLEYDKKDRKAKNALTVLSIGIPAGIAVWGTIKSLEFEKDGTITTLIGRGHIGGLIPKWFKY